MKKILTLLLVLIFVATSFATLDPSANNSRTTFDNAYAWGGHKPKDKATLWAQAVENSLDGTVTNDQLLFGLLTSDPTSTEGMFYYNTTSKAFKFYNGTSWASFAAESGTVSLDIAYNNGNSIDVDGSAVTLTVSDTDNNAGLVVAQNDSTNDPDAMNITSAADAGTAVGLQIDCTAGFDIQGTSDSWTMSIAGIFDGEGVTGLTNSQIINLAGNNEIEFGDNTEDVAFNFSVANTLTITSDQGTDKVDWGDIDAHSGLAALTGDAGADFDIGATNTGTFNMVIAQAGTGDNELRLTSAGTAANAIALTTATGGQTFTSATAIVGTAAAGAISFTSTGGDATLDASDKSVIIDAGEAAADDAIVIVTTGAGSGIQITSLADVDITTTGAATEDITLDNQGGSIHLISTEAVDDGFNLDTTGGVDIDATTSISLKSAEATGDAIELVTSNAAGGIDITSGTGDIVLTSTDEINLTVATAATDNIVLTNTAGTSVTENSGAIQLTATAGGIQIQSDANLDDAVVLRADGGVTAEMTIHNDQGTAEDAIEILSDAGGIAITYATAKNMAITGGQFIVTSNEDVASAINLVTNTGTSETIVVTNTLGQAAGAITLNAAAGGVRIDTIAGAAGDILLTAGDDATIVTAGDFIVTNTGVMTVSGTSTLSGAVTATAGIQMGAISREATADGTGTGTIATGTSFVTAVDATQVTDWMVLPSPVAGTIVWIGTVDDASGFEVRTNDPANVSMNGVVGAGKETAIPSTASLVRFVCVSNNDWIGTMFDASGTEAETPTPD